VILFLDTSALVKAYVTEPYSSDVLTSIREANNVVCHIIAYVEARAGFARKLRDGSIANDLFEAVKNEFELDWMRYSKVETTQPLLNRAADLAEAFSMRAYDSIHLAAADLLFKEAGEPVVFGCFDGRLNKAASVLGLSLMEIKG
jgi:predicted nucleic acid-binding protein